MTQLLDLKGEDGESGQDTHEDGDLNRFVKSELLNEFYFIEPKGWRRIHELQSADWMVTLPSRMEGVG